jgi:predicted RND superfamily exporter protein
MIGFLSLLSSSTVVLRDFGLFAALGILIAFVCSFVFSALILQYVSLSNSGGSITSWIADQLVIISRDIQLNSKKYWAGIIIVCTISMFGISKIKADMFVLEYFPKSNEVIRDHIFITQHWGDYFPIDFLATTSQGYSFKNNTMLKALNEFQKEVSALPEINSSMSIINLIDKASTVFLTKDVDGLLESSTQTQLFLNNMLQRPEIDVSNFISDDYHTARITLTGPLLSVSELEEKVDQIIRVSEKHFGNKAKLSVTSFPALYLRIMKYAVDSMIKSFGLAIVLIFITLAVLLKNIRLAFISMIPNLFPIFLMFAFMGVMGINLDLATATVATIALGIGVDDTIHILSYYQQERRSGHSSYSDAIIKTQSHIGRIVVISSILLCAGYLVLLLASIKTVVYFGLLTFIAVFAALIGDIILLPLLLKSSKIKP